MVAVVLLFQQGECGVVIVLFAVSRPSFGHPFCQQFDVGPKLGDQFLFSDAADTLIFWIVSQNVQVVQLAEH